jgi:hypothetical protein
MARVVQGIFRYIQWWSREGTYSLLMEKVMGHLLIIAQALYPIIKR